MSRTCIIALAVAASFAKINVAGAQNPKPMKPDSSSMPDSMPGMAMPKRPASKAKSDSMPGMRMGDSTSLPVMTADAMMIGPLGISMDRMGSGTTWIPDAVSMPSRRRMLGSWMLMGHGFAFAQYDHQSGKRGDEQFGSLNWAMLMATRDIAGGRFQARTMLSLDPLGVTERGYPLLLQNGESFNGRPIHDRQHPHDFWMELGALYQREIDKHVAWTIYIAPSGEPALGPVAFMHRPSAMDNLTAPIGHHWQDATHVSFGVITAGLFTRSWQVEASAFNGREPDQRRWNFDPLRIDSYSARLTLNPAVSWSFSAGYGYIKRPDASAPRISTHRITASLLHGMAFREEGQWASTLIWGENKRTGESSHSQSVLAESEAVLDRKNTFFGRAEFVQKDAQDLQTFPPVAFGSVPVANGASSVFYVSYPRFNVGAAELGYVREIIGGRYATLGLGTAGTINFVPAALEQYYGSRTPMGLFVFLRVRPSRASKEPAMKMSGMR